MFFTPLCPDCNKKTTYQFGGYVCPHCLQNHSEAPQGAPRLEHSSKIVVAMTLLLVVPFLWVTSKLYKKIFR